MSEKKPEIIFVDNQTQQIMPNEVAWIVSEDTTTEYVLKSIYDNDLKTYANVIKQLSEQNEQLKAEIERLKDENKWISVEDRLPKNTDSVLMFGQSIRSSGLYVDGIFHSDFKLPEHSNVTHWMLLPDMPKKPLQPIK